MRLGGFSAALALGLLCGSHAMGQAASSTASARVETAPLHLIEPDPYQVTSVLEPVREVKLVAPIDGMVRGMDAHLGASVRESHELIQFDPTEANARLRMAEAELKEKQALMQKAARPEVAAQVEAAVARVDLAKAAVNRCTVRAPFPGRVFEVAVCPGQYVLRGTVILVLADTSSLRAELPVDRRNVTLGSTITVPVEEQEVSGKVEAILPLAKSFSVLRELATPFATASVVLPNPKGQLDAGLRARPAGAPVAPIANIARRALRSDDIRGPSSSMVQVIRNEYVTNVSVRVLGGLGPDRIQVSGLLRHGDVLVVGSSVPLAPGTLVRFHGTTSSRGIEATSPNPAHGGYDAGIVPPGGNVSTAGGRSSGGTPSPYVGTARRPGAATPRTASSPGQGQSGSAPPF